MCSPLVAYRSLLVTPRSTQTASPAGPAAPEPSTTASREAGASGLHATVSSRSMPHLPVLPPTNATCSGDITPPYSHGPAGPGVRTYNPRPGRAPGRGRNEPGGPQREPCLPWRGEISLEPSGGTSRRVARRLRAVWSACGQGGGALLAEFGWCRVGFAC